MSHCLSHKNQHVGNFDIPPFYCVRSIVHTKVKSQSWPLWRVSLSLRKHSCCRSTFSGKPGQFYFQAQGLMVLQTGRRTPVLQPVPYPPAGTMQPDTILNWYHYRLGRKVGYPPSLPKSMSAYLFHSKSYIKVRGTKTDTLTPSSSVLKHHICSVRWLSCRNSVSEWNRSRGSGH